MRSHPAFSVLLARLSVLLPLLFLGCDDFIPQVDGQVFLNIDPAGIVYPEMQTVTITASPPEATIMYTLDGSDPTRTHGYQYTAGNAGFFLNESRTVKAMGYLDGWTDSEIFEENYTILYWVAACSDGSVYFSMDGGSYWWKQSLSGIGALHSLVTDGQDEWLGFGRATLPTVETTVYSSTNRFQSFASSVLSDGFEDIASDSAGTFVAVGYEDVGGDQTPFVKYSGDAGGSWQNPDFPVAPADLTAVASDGYRSWVAVGQSASVVYTTAWADGPWATGSGLSGNIFDVATNGNGDWAAVGATTGLSGGGIDGLAFYSTDDGATWTAATLPTGIPQLWSVEFGLGDTVVAIGGAPDDIPVVLYSTDAGQSYSSASHPLTATQDDLRDVHYNNRGTWTAVGRNRTIIRSTDDGATWTRSAVAPSSAGLSTDQLTSVTFGRWEH